MPYILVSRNALNCCTEKHCALQTGTCDEIIGTTVFSVCCFAWMAGGSLLKTNRILHWHNCMLQEHYLAILERIISIVCLDKSWWWNIFVLASGYSVAIIHWALNFPPQTKQFWPWSACSTRDFIGKWVLSRFQLQFFFCIVMYNWFLIFLNLTTFWCIITTIEKSLCQKTQTPVMSNIIWDFLIFFWLPWSGFW